MAYAKIKGKSFVWWHFSSLEEADFETLEKEFKFHPLDFDDLRDDGELSKLDVYKHYLFSIVNIPVFDTHAKILRKHNVSIFIGKDYVVTATKKLVDAVERLFARASRSSRLRRDVLGKTTGYFLYKLLDYIFRDAKIVLRELVRESEHVEAQVYDTHTRVTTKRLGILRRNVLQMRQVVEPQRVLISQYLNAGKKFIEADLEIYFDDVRDTLDGMSVVLENSKNIVDGLFDVNEAFLSHRTNEIIRLLTVISVVLMPPTLITGYYGMNVSSLPFGGNVFVVSGIIVFSIIAFWLLISYLDRRK
jgi:magnesium transporter